jgi:hypothetical protein
VARVFFAFTRTGKAEGLAGVAAAYNVGSNNVSPVDSFNVSMIRHLGPMFREDAGRVWVYFGLPDDFHPGAFKAEVEAADTGE